MKHQTKDPDPSLSASAECPCCSFMDRQQILLKSHQIGEDVFCNVHALEAKGYVSRSGYRKMAEAKPPPNSDKGLKEGVSHDCL